MSQILHRDHIVTHPDFAKEGFHQAVLSAAYAHWQLPEHQKWSYADMLAHTEREYGTLAKLAVMLGKYNQQVGNGGHHQYLYNGYASTDRHDYTELDLHQQLIDLFLQYDLDKLPYGQQIRVILEKLDNAVEFAEEYETETCWQCDGSGQMDDPDDSDEEIECDQCNGSGKIEWHNPYYPLSEGSVDRLDLLDTEYCAMSDAWLKSFEEWLIAQ